MCITSIHVQILSGKEGVVQGIAQEGQAGAFRPADCLHLHRGDYLHESQASGRSLSTQLAIPTYEEVSETSMLVLDVPACIHMMPRESILPLLQLCPLVSTRSVCSQSQIAGTFLCKASHVAT